MNFFQRRSILKSTNSLDLIPVRIAKYDLEEDGTVVLLIPKFKNEKFGNWFVPKTRSNVYRVNLDEIGSAFWLETDGVKTIHEISNILVEKFKERVSPESDKRIGKFVSNLYENRYITFKQLM